jgi:hypothetical protein
VSARALDLVKNRGEDLLAEYQRRFVNVLNADDAAELFPDYTASLESRTKYRAAVHPAAEQIRDELFRRALKDPKVKEIVFTAGGPGVGKSVGAPRTGEAVMDTMLSGPTRPFQWVEATLNAGKRVQIAFTFRRIQDALGGVLERSKAEGRTVPIDYLIENHEGAARNVAALYEQYKDNPNVTFRFIDNSGPQSALGTIDLTKKQNYREARSELHAILESKRKEVSPDVYKITKGNQRRARGSDRTADRR